MKMILLQCVRHVMRACLCPVDYTSIQVNMRAVAAKRRERRFFESPGVWIKRVRHAIKWAEFSLTCLLAGC